jgi:hypothetical protein
MRLSTSAIFYHIQRIGGTREEWFQGDEKEISSETFNYFYSSLLEDLHSHFELVDDKKIGMVDYAKQFLKDSSLDNLVEIEYGGKISRSVVSQKNLNQKILEYSALTSKLTSSLSQYTKWIREEVFEQIRVKEFAQLPSRKNCIWLSTENDLPVWWNMFGDIDKKILKVRLPENSIVHRANSSCLPNSDTLSISEIEEMARKYWTGEVCQQHTDEIETLFIGNMEILKEFKSLNDLTKDLKQ